MKCDIRGVEPEALDLAHDSRTPDRMAEPIVPGMGLESTTYFKIEIHLPQPMNAMALPVIGVGASVADIAF